VVDVGDVTVCMRIGERMIAGDIYSDSTPLCLENGGKGSNEISKRGNCAKTRAAFSKRDAPFKLQMLII